MAQFFVWRGTGSDIYKRDLLRKVGGDWGFLTGNDWLGAEDVPRGNFDEFCTACG